MRFVFKLSFTLIGGLLIGLSGLLSATRDEKGVRPLVVTQGVDQIAEVWRIGFMLPRLPSIHWITPAKTQLTLLQTSPNSEWQYLSEASDTHQHHVFILHRFYRTRGDGTDEQTIVDGIEFWRVVLAPNFEWLVFVQEHGEPPRNNIFRISTNGTRQENLTERFAGEIARQPPILSDDGQWVLFMASELGEAVGIYRVSVAGGPVELIVRVDDATIAQIWPLIGTGWLGATIRGKPPYGLNIATGEFKPLFNLPEEFSLTSFRVIVPKANLLIQRASINENGNYEQIWLGVRLGDTTPLWQLDNRVRTVLPLPDGEWLILAGDDGIERMRVDGSEREWIYKPVLNWLLSPDGTWLYFSEQDQGKHWVKRVRVLDGYMELFATLSHEPLLQHWSPDGRWLTMTNHYADFSAKIDFLDTKTGIVYANVPPEDSIWPVGWGARINRQWQPSLLGGIGAGLLLFRVAFRRRKKCSGGV